MGSLAKNQIDFHGKKWYSNKYPSVGDKSFLQKNFTAAVFTKEDSFMNGNEIQILIAMVIYMAVVVGIGAFYANGYTSTDINEMLRRIDIGEIKNLFMIKMVINSIHI